MILLLSFLFLFLWFKPGFGEMVLHYEIFYGPLKVGESKIILSAKEYKAITFTTGVGDLIYPYRAEWITLIDEKGYPLKTIIHSKDRFKERKKVILFNPKNQSILVEKLLPTPKKKNFQIPFPIYDELTAFIASWKLNFKEQKEHELPLYIDGEKYQVKIKYLNFGICKLFNQTESCYKLLAILPEKSELLKRSKEVQIELSSNWRVPIEIRGSLPLFGSLKAVLKEKRSFEN